MTRGCLSPVLTATPDAQGELGVRRQPPRPGETLLPRARGREGAEPRLPPFVKINPDSPPGLAEGLQPGDMSMGAAAEEFLKMDEGEDEPV